MAQRRHHYERAFEKLLRSSRIPYVAVDEAKKTLLPAGASLELSIDGEPSRRLKNFDFVVYGDDQNLLIEIKGRKMPALKRDSGKTPRSKPRLENWVSADDAESLSVWRRLFGPGFDAAFVFVYWCEDQPPDGIFDEVFERDGRWYVARAVLLDDYVGSMKTRSPKWRTVDLPAAAYERLARPFVAPRSAGPRLANGLVAPAAAGPGVPAMAALA